MAIPQAVINLTRDFARQKRDRLKSLRTSVEEARMKLKTSELDCESFEKECCDIADFLQEHDASGTDWRLELQLPAVHVEWPDPGKGYRLLIKGEVTQAFDEYLPTSGHWEQLPASLMSKPQGKPQVYPGRLGSFPVRRKLRTEAV